MGPSEAARRQPELFVLDVRSRREWDAGHIEGSQHISVSRLPGALSEIDPGGRPILAVCQVGYRSEMATHYLRLKGLDAQNLEGGLQAWMAAGLPLTTASNTPGVLLDPVWDTIG